MKEKNKINFYSLLWIFVTGAVFGWAIELIWFVIKWGYFQYNQGLVFGPFQQIYGFGALLLVFLGIVIEKLPLKKDLHKYIVAFIIGAVFFGLFEFFSGFLVEKLSGTFSWDYSRVGFNFVIGKYVYLPYCLVWGIFAVIWFKWIYNPLLNFINKRMNKVLKIFTIILFVFLVVDFSLTIMAADRKLKREQEIPAANVVDKFLDRCFDDKYFKKILPKIRTAKK